MSDGLQTLSSVTGLSKEALVRIAEEVKANLRVLDACTDHQFVAAGTRDYRCTRCHGRVDAQAYRWYMKGRAHEAGF